MVIVASDDQNDGWMPVGDGTMARITEDGGVEFGQEAAPERKATGFDENLALDLDTMVLGQIASEILEGVQADLQSRLRWSETIKRAYDLLGVEVKDPNTGAGTQGATSTGISNIKNPLLMGAVVQFQANARGELLPANGPVKVKDDGDESDEAAVDAEALERAFNHYLTITAREYVPDTDRGLFRVGLEGGIFKKVYECPLRRRQASDTVFLDDVIISADATDTETAARVTHRLWYRRAMIQRMQKAGVWRDVDLGEGQPSSGTGATQKAKEVQGVDDKSQLPRDYPHEIYETITDLDIPTMSVDDGLYVPYRVTIDKQSQQVLDIRRWWKEDDENYTRKPVWVLYPYILGLDFYPLGLVHLLGNHVMALTAIDRESVDAGMFANFPGLLVTEIAQKQTTNQIVVPPGGAHMISTGELPIKDAVLPLPYHDLTPGLMKLREQIMTEGKQLGSFAELNIGEGTQNAPVGTTVALIEQATKPTAAVHKRLWAAQAMEFRILRDLFRENPEPLVRHLVDDPEEKERVLRALENREIEPAADPNVPSHMHRVMQATALAQLAALPIFTPRLDGDEVLKKILSAIRVSDADPLVLSPDQQAANAAAQAAQQGGKAAPQNDPSKIAAIAQRETDSQRKAATQTQEFNIRRDELQVETANQAADREAQLRIAEIEQETERMRVGAQHENATSRLEHDHAVAAHDIAIRHRDISSRENIASMAHAAKKADTKKRAEKRKKKTK